jgi:malate permease and related proteins
MDIAMTTMKALGIIFLMGSIGAILSRRGLMDRKASNILSVLALDVALPCLVFHNITTRFDPYASPDWWQLPLWWAAGMVLFLAMSLLFSRTARRGLRREFAVSLFYPNGIFFPLAILSEVYGTTDPLITDLFIFTLFFPAFFFNTFSLFFARRVCIDWPKLMHPVGLATILAIAITYCGCGGLMPEFIYSTLQQIGAMSIPLLMIVTGGRLYDELKEWKNLRWGQLLFFTGLKNIVWPLLMIAALILLQPAWNIAFLLMIQAAVPPITAVPIMTERSGGDAGFTGNLLAASFLVSFITLPAAIHLFYMLFPQAGAA